MHYFDSHGWYTSTPIVGRVTSLAPANTSETTTDGQPRANFTGYAWVDLPYKTPLAETPPPATVPQIVTRRQAKQALLLGGKLTMVQPAIDAIPDATQRALIQIEWDDSQEFQRNRASVIAIGTAVGLDSAALDQLFIAASGL